MTGQTMTLKEQLAIGVKAAGTDGTPLAGGNRSYPGTAGTDLHPPGQLPLYILNIRQGNKRDFHPLP
jgi:hypothetical protein